MKHAIGIAAHAILAIGGLVMAYLVWTDDAPDVSEDEVTVLECDADAITRVELRSEEKDVTLELRGQGEERTAWFTVVRHPENGEPATERFVGAAEATREWLGQIAPLRARRSLGELSGEQLESVELDEPEGRLTIACGGRDVTYQLGGRSYGTGDRYLRANGGGPVYLVASDRLAPLESAEFRLMERALHTVEGRDVVQLELRAFGQTKRLLQHNRLDEAAAEWVDAADPERRNETYGNWMSRFPRLRVQSYLAPDAGPGSDLDEAMSVAPEPVMRVTYQGERGADLGFFELQRVNGASLADYARTETTRSWVRVPSSVAQQIEEDLRSMLSVAPLERPAPPAPAATDAGAAADAGVAPAPEAPTPTE